jgi:processive 1,2-diacylglycerol beta-glucosyltransferase
MRGTFSESLESLLTVAFPRVLVVTATAGHGHARAARAVAAALRTRHPQLDVAEVDILAKMPRWFSSTYRAGYLWMVDRHPMLWRHFYETNETNPTALGHWLSIAAGKKFVRSAIAWKPDLIIATHFLAPELFGWAHRAGLTKIPIHVVVTDHDIHRIWWQPEVEEFYVTTDVVKARLSYRFGVPPARIHVTGIPIDAAFRDKRDPVAIRARFGLSAQRPTVLFLSGGFASGPVSTAILGIWQDRPDVQVIAVCGKNVRAQRRLADLPRPAGGTLHVLGFRDDVPDLMAIADLVVGKSGGLTMSEAMAMGKPLIVSHSIAGQEERNADAVLAAGAGVKAPTPEEVRWHVVRLVSKPDELRAMSLRAKAFGRPFAADDVADRVAERVGIQPVVAPPAHGAPRATVQR